MCESDVVIVAVVYSCSAGVACFEARIEQCCAMLREDLKRLNDEVHSRVHHYLEGAVRNLAANIRYEFLESHGPHRQQITAKQPLFPRLVLSLLYSPVEELSVFMCRYFHVVGGGGPLSWEEVESNKGQLVAAHNGWVMNADPLKNFALDDSLVRLTFLTPSIYLSVSPFYLSLSLSLCMCRFTSSVSL